MKMKKRDYVLILLSIISIVYYICCVLSLGFRVSLVWMWLLYGIVMMGIVIIDYKEMIQVSKVVKRIILTSLVVIFGLFISVEGLIISHFDDNGSDNLDYIIVLGSKVNGTKASKSLRDRCNKAYDYLIDHHDTIAILSGGKGNDEDISEAQCMYDLLIEKGIPENQLIKEDQSTSTNENLINSYQYIKDKNSNVGLVTSNFHVFRALMLADKKGLKNIEGMAAHYDPFWLPHYMVREFICVCIDFVRG